MSIRPEDGGIKDACLLMQISAVICSGERTHLFKAQIYADYQAVRSDIVMRYLHPGCRLSAVMFQPRQMQPLPDARFTRMGMHQRRNQLQQRQKNDQKRA